MQAWYELIGMALAWLEGLFVLQVLDLVDAPLLIPVEDWFPLLSVPKKTIEGMQLPSALLDGYNTALETIADLMPINYDAATGN